MSATHTAAATFLFTDIGGSTRRRQDHPDGIRDALERHDEMVADIVNDHTGTVFKNTGDDAAAAFATSSNAVLATADLQSAFDAEDWGAVGRVRARMGVHTGDP